MATASGNFTTFGTEALAGNAFTWDSGTVGDVQTSNNDYPDLQGPFLAGTSGYSNYIKATDPQSDVPASATAITEVRIKVERSCTIKTDIHVDKNLYLVVGGVIKTAVDKADTSTVWEDSDLVVTYTFNSGDITAIGGISVAQARASDFGVVFAVDYSTEELNSPTWLIDHISYEIDYTPAVSSGRRRYNNVFVL